MKINIYLSIRINNDICMIARVGRFVTISIIFTPNRYLLGQVFRRESEIIIKTILHPNFKSARRMTTSKIAKLCCEKAQSDSKISHMTS